MAAFFGAYAPNSVMQFFSPYLPFHYLKNSLKFIDCKLRVKWHRRCIWLMSVCVRNLVQEPRGPWCKFTSPLKPQVPYYKPSWLLIIEICGMGKRLECEWTEKVTLKMWMRGACHKSTRLVPSCSLYVILYLRALPLEICKLWRKCTQCCEWPVVCGRTSADRWSHNRRGIAESHLDVNRSHGTDIFVDGYKCHWIYFVEWEHTKIHVEIYSCLRV
jgi:hypothetical protein